MDRRNLPERKDTNHHGQIQVNTRKYDNKFHNLLRLSNNAREKMAAFDNVIFIGNGAIKNGEKPLEEWMFHHENDEMGKEFINQKKIAFNTYLSFFSIVMKSARLMHTESKNTLSEIIAQKEHLANLYCQERFLLKQRKTPECLKNYLYQENTLIICSNWDSVFWNKSKIKNICQIHGSCLTPMSMIFPCER